MTLGIVISDTEIELGDNFKWVHPSDLTSGTTEIPVIYVGMEYTSELLGIELDVMDRCIKPDRFWTFTRKEHRTHHATDMMNFVDYCYNRLIEDVKYVFIDPLLMTEEEHTNLFAGIKSSGNLVSYINKDMVYMCNDNTIYGINLMFYQYVGLDREKLLVRVNAISDVLLEGDGILIEYNDFMEAYNEQLRYIPYLYSVNTHVT